MLQPMNVLDAGLLMMESAQTPMHIGGVQILRLPRGEGVDYVRKVVEQVMRHPADGAPFNYRLAAGSGPLGMPAWEVLDDVDLSEHVFRHALPYPGGERELFALVSRLNSGPLDRGRPLWEQHYIEGLSGRRWATFTRIHHALMDGKWGMRLAHETTSADPRARHLPPYWAVRFDKAADAEDGSGRDQAQPGWWERQTQMRRQGAETLTELRKAFGRMIESYRHPSDDGLVSPYVAPECVLNGKLTARRELGVVRLELARIKRLAHANEATVNEVVLCICGGALRRYLLARDALPDKSLVANMPIAVARADAGSGGNAIVSGMVYLATHLADPAGRFRAVRGSSRHAKELYREMPSQAALSIYLGVSGSPFILAQLAGQAEKVHAQTLVISNVPGPRERRYVNGAELLSEFPISLLVPGQAMNITVVSLADALDVAVLVCPSLAPAPQEVADGIADSLDELERALGPRRSATRKSRTTPKTASRRTQPAARRSR